MASTTTSPRLSMTQGQMGSLQFSNTSPGKTLYASFLSASAATMMLQTTETSIALPPSVRQTPGLYLVDVREDNRSILHRLLEVLPGEGSALPPKTWLVAAPSADPPSFEIASPPGPPGAKGAKGATGRPGKNGANGKDGVDAPSLSEILDSVQPRLFTAETSTPQGTANADGLWLRLSSPPAGSLLRIAIKCRSNRGSMASGSWFLGIWEQSINIDDAWVRIGTSTNAAEQVPGQLAVWEFFGPRLSGRPIRLMLLSSREDVWKPGPVIGVSCSPATDGSRIITISNGTGIDYIAQLTYTFTTPAEAPLDGAPGTKGPTGDKGPAGRDGANGKDGKNGANGKDGDGLIWQTELGTGFFDSLGVHAGESPAALLSAHLAALRRGVRSSVTPKMVFHFDGRFYGTVCLPATGNMMPDGVVNVGEVYSDGWRKLWNASAPATIDWGDGSSESIPIDRTEFRYFSHTYSSRPLSAITVTGEFTLGFGAYCAQESPSSFWTHRENFLKHFTSLEIPTALSPVRYQFLFADYNMSAVNQLYPIGHILNNMDNLDEYPWELLLVFSRNGLLDPSLLLAHPIGYATLQYSWSYTLAGALEDPLRRLRYIPPLWEDPAHRFDYLLEFHDSDSHFFSGKPFALSTSASNYALAQSKGWA